MIEVVLRAHGVEHHVAVGQQHFAFVVCEANRVRKHLQWIGLCQFGYRVEVAQLKRSVDHPDRVLIEAVA